MGTAAEMTRAGIDAPTIDESTETAEAQNKTQPNHTAFLTSLARSDMAEERLMTEEALQQLPTPEASPDAVRLEIRGEVHSTGAAPETSQARADAPSLVQESNVAVPVPGSKPTDKRRRIYAPLKRLPKRLKLSCVAKTKFLETGSHASSSNHGSGDNLTSLPAEVLGTVYSLLPHVRDQIAFTLSCRFLASIALASPQDLKRSVTPRMASGKRYRFGAEHLLVYLRRWNWIPYKARFKVCRRCVKYLPLNKVWTVKVSDGQEVELRKLKKVDWTWCVMRWWNKSGHVCPRCQVEDALSLSVSVDEWTSAVCMGTAAASPDAERLVIKAWGDGWAGDAVFARREGSVDVARDEEDEELEEETVESTEEAEKEEEAEPKGESEEEDSRLMPAEDLPSSQVEEPTSGVEGEMLSPDFHDRRKGSEADKPEWCCCRSPES